MTDFTKLAALAAAMLLASAAHAAPGNARDGLRAMQELNLIVLETMTANGQETEGKAYVGGDLTVSGSTQIGIGNGVQGSATSSRATLSVGGRVNGSVKLHNGSNGGSGNLAAQVRGHIAGDAGEVVLQDTNAALRVGGALQKVSLTDGTTLEVGGSVVQNLDLGSNSFVRVGGNVAQVQGGSNNDVRVTGDVSGTLNVTGGSSAAVGGSVQNASLASGTRLSVHGNLNNAGLGNDSVVTVLGNASNINGAGGAALYAGGSIGGNANGASFSANYAFGVIPVPVVPGAPVVASLAADTAQLDADLRALSDALGNLTAVGGSITNNGQGPVFRAVTTAAGYASFDVDETIFDANEFTYDFDSLLLPVIFNVRHSSAAVHAARTASYTMHSNFTGNARANNHQVIWNFTDASTLDLQRQFQGSVLAPHATLTANVIEGSVVAKIFSQSNEVHLGTYARSIDMIADHVGSVPEPAVWLQLITGFGCAGTLLRRRRHAYA